MRSVVDRFFGDNWVVHVHGGLTADLGREWGRYGAARSAVAGVLGEESVRGLHVGNAKLIGQCMAELRAYLTMGILVSHILRCAGRGFGLENLHCLTLFSHTTTTRCPPNGKDRRVRPRQPARSPQLPPEVQHRPALEDTPPPHGGRGAAGDHLRQAGRRRVDDRPEARGGLRRFGLARHLPPPADVAARDAAQGHVPPAPREEGGYLVELQGEGGGDDVRPGGLLRGRRR